VLLGETGIQVTKSRTFAVILTAGEQLQVHFLCKKIEKHDAGDNRQLTHTFINLPWPTSDRDKLIEMLTAAGLTTRHYGPGERQWMDSATWGTVRAPGQRDGQWHQPDLDTFEREYLAIV